MKKSHMTFLFIIAAIVLVVVFVVVYLGHQYENMEGCPDGQQMETYMDYCDTGLPREQMKRFGMPKNCARPRCVPTTNQQIPSTNGKPSSRPLLYAIKQHPEEFAQYLTQNKNFVNKFKTDVNFSKDSHQNAQNIDDLLSKYSSKD